MSFPSGRLPLLVVLVVWPVLANWPGTALATASAGTFLSPATPRLSSETEASDDAAHPAAGQRASRPAAALGFDGIDVDDLAGAQTPPSPSVGASDHHVVTAVNGAIQVFDRAGNSLVGPVAPTTFFAGGPTECTHFPYHPQALFDEEHERFLLGFTELAAPPTDLGGFCLAVSQTADPTGPWDLHFFPINEIDSYLGGGVPEVPGTCGPLGARGPDRPTRAAR